MLFHLLKIIITLLFAIRLYSLVNSISIQHSWKPYRLLSIYFCVILKAAK